MHRRIVLKSALGMLLPGFAQAALNPVGPGISRAWVSHPVRVLQKCPLWCWAASVSMVFASNDHPTDQMKIVQRSLGGAMACTTAMPTTIGQDLSQHWVDDNGDDFDSTVTAAYDVWNGIYTLSNAFIVNELSNDRPLLYCNSHHAMLLVAVDFIATPMGPNIIAAGVVDPWWQAPAFHPLTPAELRPAHLGGQMNFLAAAIVS